jgi:hypothetical protein
MYWRIKKEKLLGIDDEEHPQHDRHTHSRGCLIDTDDILEGDSQDTDDKDYRH